jgi:dihydroxyacetone kinase phosphoprotein-dependent L subunit
MEKLNVVQVKSMLLYVAEKIIECKPYLTEVDSKIGDGDHGIGMETGFLKVKELLLVKEFKSINEIFRESGMAMLNSMGGASGVIFSSIFLGGIKGAADNMQEITATDFADIMSKSLSVIKQRGKAEPGDKTMVDAFEPACRAMKEYAGEGADFLAMLTEAEKAAKDGMEATKDYVAKFGRAKSLMERAVGYQDAGATSVYLMFSAMREWAQ